MLMGKVEPATKDTSAATSATADRVEQSRTGPTNDAAGAAAVSRISDPDHLTLAQVTTLFNAMSHETFVDSTGQRDPIPFHYPIDGCYDRAYDMAKLLQEKGYHPQKVFAMSRKADGSANLHPTSKHASDGTNEVRWWYHVAPILIAVLPNGTEAEMVIDPSMADRPLTIAEWTGLMNPDKFDRLSADEIRGFQAAGSFPAGRNIVYTATGGTYSPSDDPEVQGNQVADTEHAQMLPTLTQYATQKEPAHALAGRLRDALATKDPDAVNKVWQAASAGDRQLFTASFPQLTQEVTTRMSQLPSHP